MPAPKTLPVSGRAASMPHPHQAKKVNPAKLHAEVKAALGINLMAESPADTVHGHISTVRKAAGLPFGRRNGVEIDDCPMCEATVPRDQAHDCCEVILYEAAEGPNAEHKTTIASHGLTAEKKATLLALVTAHRAPPGMTSS